MTYLLLLLMSTVSLAFAEENIAFDSVKVRLGDTIYELEHAQSFEQRAQGLMFRQTLCQDCGMLFTFPKQRIGSIWMKNTYIPLDLAYVDEQGVIVEIHQLAPFDLTAVKSSIPVRYAIEMNEGWFESKKVTVGTKITIDKKRME